MARLSSDGSYVTVQWGDTLSQIALDYCGSASKYRQLAAINGISNPNLIYVGQKIYLGEDSGGGGYDDGYDDGYGSGSGSGSGSGGSYVHYTPSSYSGPSITQFGLLSTNEKVLFATWNWTKSNTDSYKVLWTYDPGNGVWFIGEESSISVDSDSPETSRQSMYNIPEGARKVRFKVKPISETFRNNDTDVHYWTASWSSVKTYTNTTPIAVPDVPTVEIDKYKLTATLDNLPSEITNVQFQVVKDNSASVFKTGTATVVSNHASFSCSVDAGGEYKVRCRAYSTNGNEYSEWSKYSANYTTMPATPSKIINIKATSETSVYVEWEAAATAKTYELQWSTTKEYIDSSDQTSSQSNIEFTHFEKSGLESGKEYFFRVRAVNDGGESGWSEIKSIAIGKAPAAPTTWSSTTTCITGETLILYWVHNAGDGSIQTYADLEIYIGGEREAHTIRNVDGDDDNKICSYTIETADYIEGTQIQWRVRTAGVTKQYGPWSVQRTVDVYAPPSLELKMIDIGGNVIDKLTSFPFFIYGLAGPKTQVPVGYHLVVVANEHYETTDNIGNVKTIKTGEQVYSKYFDTADVLMVELSAGNIDLENNVSYTVSCTVNMNSGLTCSASLDFTVSWADIQYVPNAEIGINRDTFTASIRPYCENIAIEYRKVIRDGYIYSVSDEVVSRVYGEPVRGIKTTTGEQVYFGVTASDTELYYCTVEVKSYPEDVMFSVYRREFDGNFTELALNLDGAKQTTIIDPHPALDLARYRIVAISKATGSVTYYDPPGYPVGGTAVILQWDEQWTTFETSEANAMEQPSWSGSMLKLPYNIDVADSIKPDVSLVKYIGRTHPVSYYGTQVDVASTWNVAIEQSDKETLYALRRLSMWTGDVYVREPSGSGYWANVAVSFSQKHCNLTIPVTLDIVRVAGGA